MDLLPSNSEQVCKRSDESFGNRFFISCVNKFKFYFFLLKGQKADIILYHMIKMALVDQILPQGSTKMCLSLQIFSSLSG